MRLALIADVHGNLPALEAVVADLAGRAVDRVLNLGDCLSGPLWPAETLDRLRDLGWPTVRGNHDRQVGLDDPTTLGRTDAFTAAALDAAGRRWLADLPERLEPLPGLLAVHARPGADDAYLLEEVEGGRLRPAGHAAVASRLAGVVARVVTTAHSHQPGLLHVPDGPLVVNPGSVGCPAYHDPGPPEHRSETGSPLARYAVLDLSADGAPGAVQFIALPYDHETAARRADSLGRPDWALALRTGAAAP